MDPFPACLSQSLSGLPRASDDFEIIAVGKRWELRSRQRLVPESDRGDIVLQRQILAILVRAPTEGLNRHSKVALEANGIGDVPAIHPEALLRAINSVGADHLRQSRVRRGEFNIRRFTAQAEGLVDAAGIEVVSAAEIILGAGAADGGKFRVAIDEEFYLAFAPPAAVVDTPSHVGADELPATFHFVEDRVDLLVRQRVGAPELGMKIGAFFRYFAERVVDLVVDVDLLVAQVLHREAGAFAERHFPITIEGAAGIDAHRQ